MRYANRWTLPDVTFYQVEDHGFPAFIGQPMFAYGKPDAMDDKGLLKVGEFHTSLDRALIAWVGEKYTGPRGAGGTGVGTAADWFARMIGMDTLVPISYTDRNKVVAEVLADTASENGPLWRRARAVGDALEARGLTVATVNTP